MTARLTRLATGVTGACLTLAVLVGPPWLLTTFVGPPIPASWPDLDTLRAIATVGVTDTFVITTLAVIVWGAWVQLAVAIAAEAAAAIRRRPSIRLPLLPGAQPLAARLVAASLLLVTVLQPRPIAAASPLELAVATSATGILDQQPAAAPESSAAARPEVRPPTRTIDVGERDSWWSLAETHLGDGLRWRELRELNTGRTVHAGVTLSSGTEQLKSGWTLLVPATGDHQHPSADAASDRPADVDTEPVEQAWEVQPGEHFWHIAEATLTQTWERQPADAEIVAYWRTLIEANRDRLAPPGDPNLIHPGQRFELPPVPEDPSAATPTEPDQIQPPPDADLPPPDDSPSHLPDQSGTDQDDATTKPAPPATSAPATPPPSPAPATPDGQTTTTDPDIGPDQTSQRPEPPTSDRAGHPATPLGVPAAAASAAIAAAVAAAGVIALVRRRRRTLLTQRPAGWRLPTPAPEMQHQLGTLEHVAPNDGVLDDLAALLATLPAEVDPPLVVIHDDGPISLIDVDTDLPPPWMPDPGGPGEPARWTARIGDRGQPRSIGLPLLVTLGHTGSSTVFANLGALGVLPIDGAPNEVTARLRTMTLELATSRLAGPLEITVCNDDTFTDLDQIVAADDPHTAIAETVADTQAGIIDHDRLPRMIVCHSPTRVEVPPAAKRFCGLITAGAADADGWALQVDGDHGWLQIPNSEPQRLTPPDLDPTLIADELATLSVDALTHESDEPTPDPAGPAATDTAPYCQIAVLGPITVTCDDNVTGPLTPIARQLLTYLATHRDGVTLEQLDAAIWPELPPSTGGQRARTALTRLRTTLGDGPDDQPLLPRRARNTDPIELSAHVSTDLDHAFALLDTARHTDNPEHALETRLAALALIRGQPFAGLTVSWSVDIEQRAITQLQDAALTVAQQLSDAGEYDQAVWAIRQGLELCDPTEPLYVAWAHIEHARGRPDRIPHLWRRLQRLYADDADEIAGIITTPTTDTELAFSQLLADR